jgi:hypothetical protein
MMTNCYGIIDASPGSLHLVAYTDAGGLIETLDLTRPAPPAAPDGLTAAASGNRINLAWTDNADNETGFKIERSTNGIDFSQVATTGSNTTSYADAGLAANTHYYYRVRACNTIGDSAYSNTADATTGVGEEASVTSIGRAKACTDGTTVDITSASVVTLVPPEAGVFYAQDTDGTAGIRVETPADRPAVHATVLIKGQLGLKPNGERAILNASLTPAGSAAAAPKGMSNKAVGGRGYIGSENSGSSSQGLLVRIWGKVTKAISDPAAGQVFWLDDGSNVDSGEADGTKGIRVMESGLSPSTGAFLKVTGVVGSEIKNGKPIRVLRFRDNLP